MADYYLGCDNGTFEQFNTISGQQIRCNGDLVNITEAELINSFSAVALNDWLNLAFATPPSEEIQAAFLAGCSIPLIAWLTAWAYGSVINWMSPEHDR